MASLKSQTLPLQIPFEVRFAPLFGPEFLRPCYPKLALFEPRPRRYFAYTSLNTSVPTLDSVNKVGS